MSQREHRSIRVSNSRTDSITSSNPGTRLPIGKHPLNVPLWYSVADPVSEDAHQAFSGWVLASVGWPFFDQTGVDLADLETQ